MINHVSTLEQGQKLKELGWNKPTAFVWVICFGGYHLSAYTKVCNIVEPLKYFPAILAEEALGELPSEIGIGDGRAYYLDICKSFTGVYGVGYWDADVDFYKMINNKSLVIAATDMLVWALQNNYVKGERV